MDHLARKHRAQLHQSAVRNFIDVLCATLPYAFPWCENSEFRIPLPLNQPSPGFNDFRHIQP